MTEPPHTIDATACIIGAGAAGLAMGKALADRGIDFDWFEKGSMVGGLWQIDNDNGGSAAYESLHLNSSRPLTQYPSYPMPEDWPDFPRHDLVASYFDDFADHFGLRERITFNTEVTAVQPDDDRTWLVTTGDGVTRRYRHVLICNGHHSAPKIPELPGEFTGESWHAHEFRNAEGLKGKRVLVLGVGNSGMDLACEASRVAAKTFLATRHGVHVIPKYLLGKPLDQWGTLETSYLPFEVQRRFYEALIRLTAGRPQDRGLPEPDHRLLAAHPTVSAELYDRVGHGDVLMKPDIERLGEGKVEFVDGSVEEIDVLIYATGYRIEFPFLDRDVFDPAGNQMPLYERVVPPHLPGLWFIGFIQTLGSSIPLYEYQAEWVGDLITGECVLPSTAEMQRWIADDAAAMAKQYLRSDRHTIQVVYWRYIRALKAERRRTPGGPSLLGRLRSVLPV